MADDLERLLKLVHPRITTFDFEGKQTPCIEIDAKRYDDILFQVAGKAISINTDLNILDDKMGHVFVEITLTFSKCNIVEKFLVNGNTDLAFFKSLAETSLLALSSPKSLQGAENVFMIQMPRPQKAQEALDLILDALARQ